MSFLEKYFSVAIIQKKENRAFSLRFSVLTGVVHSGFCVGIPPGKVHEEGLFWTAKGCRNGGTVLCVFLIQLTWFFFYECLLLFVIWPIFAMFKTVSISLNAPGMQWLRRAWHSLCSEMTSPPGSLLSSPSCFFLSASTGWLRTGWTL